MSEPYNSLCLEWPLNVIRYATPAPAAFDLANHFSEWTGFDCDYNLLPTRSQRRGFLQEYTTSYNHHLGQDRPNDEEVRRLFDEVDLFRGVPGFYWYQPQTLLNSRHRSRD